MVLNSPKIIKPLGSTTGLNQADLNPNWQNSEEPGQHRLSALLQGFSASSEAVRYRFTRERSLVQAQPCPSRTSKMRQAGLPEPARVPGRGRAEASAEIRKLAAAAFRSRML